jgi:hypothetical protein
MGEDPLTPILLPAECTTGGASMNTYGVIQRHTAQDLAIYRKRLVY